MTANVTARNDRVARKAVGVPRRFGAATMLIMMTMYGVLFRLLVWLGTDPRIIGTITLFVTGVAIGQAVLFQGKKPRAASILSGALLCPLMLIAAYFTARLYGVPEILPPGVNTLAKLMSVCAYSSLVGTGLGYFAGCAAAGVFFIMDRVRKAGTQSADAVPWDRANSSAEDAPPAKSGIDERFWGLACKTARTLSPLQGRRPVREVGSTFATTLLLLVLAAPFVSWPWRLRFIAVSFLVAGGVAFLFSGLRQCGWKWAAVLVLVGGVGAIFPAGLLGWIHVGGVPIDYQFSWRRIYVVAALVGVLIGMAAAAGLGWLLWTILQRVVNARANRWKVGLGMLSTALLVLVVAGVCTGIIQVSETPEQKALAFVHQRDGWVSVRGGSWYDVSQLYLHGKDVTDMDLPRLSTFENLRVLDLADTSITDDGLAQLPSLPCLNYLRISGTRISGDGLRHLQTATNLTSLSLWNSPISDDALVHLSGMVNVQYLGLEGTEITDDGLQQLKPLTNLNGLSLDRCDITDKGLGHLEELSRIGKLGLQATRITDAGLVHLNKMNWLKRLDLSNTEITDAGLVHLRTLKGLTSLNLQGTRVTAAAAYDLEDALPLCEVIWSKD